MSTPAKDGGPAFPQWGAQWDNSPRSGMSLRDWFAGQALAGMLAKGSGDGFASASPVLISANAYSYADAMLAAREATAKGATL